MEVNFKATNVFDRVWEAHSSTKNRVIILEGGTGSSKTYSLAQVMALLLIKENGIEITVARKTFPSLRATAMKDTLRILREFGIYRDEFHDKSNNIYRYRSNTIEFISVDDPIKIRSRRRNYLWMNEANEFTKEDYMQLAMRTDKQIFMDYNPSHQFHWIYDELQPRVDVVWIPSTYLDNPFLSPEIIKEIEGYKEADQNYWRIYGLGLRGITEALVFTHWQYCNELPDNPDSVFYGLDFGYNNPTALIKIVVKDKEYYWDEILYESGLTNLDLIKRLEDLGISKTIPIYADNQEPARIEEIARSRFNVMPCVKGLVKDGIDKIKSRKFYITKESVNLLRELKSYSWMSRDGKNLEDVIKKNDHLLDAGRCAIVSEESGVVEHLPEQNKNTSNPVLERKARPSSSGLLDRPF